MTDNEILKALECHSETSYNQNACERCPILNHCDCGGKMAQNALALINRQKAEIEELKKALYEGLKLAQAEAIKCFAERLKKIYESHIVCTWTVLNPEIDTLVQEMVGDEDGTVY